MSEGSRFEAEWDGGGFGGDLEVAVGALSDGERTARDGCVLYIPVRVGRRNVALCGLLAVYKVSGLEVVLVVVLTGRFVEEGVVIETSALTERGARERHVLLTHQ